MSEWNKRYAKAVCAAASDIDEMTCNVMLYEENVRKIITKHLTPVFRELLDEAKKAQQP